MCMVNNDVIEKILDMSRISVDPAEKDKFVTQLKEIIGYFEKISELDTSAILDKESPFQEKDIYVKDEIVEGLTQPDLRKYTKNYLDGYYTVPKIFDKK